MACFCAMSLGACSYPTQADEYQSKSWSLSLASSPASHHLSSPPLSNSYMLPRERRVRQDWRLACQLCRGESQRHGRKTHMQIRHVESLGGCIDKFSGLLACATGSNATAITRPIVLALPEVITNKTSSMLGRCAICSRQALYEEFGYAHTMVELKKAETAASDSQVWQSIKSTNCPSIQALQL